MKYLLILFLVVTKVTVAQTVKPEKVLFIYVKGGSSWGVPGVYSRYETIEMTLVNRKDYKITSYFTIVKSIAADSTTFLVDTTYKKTAESSRVPKVRMDLLLNQLNQTKDNFTYSFIKPLLRKPSRSHIIDIANKFDRLYALEDYDDKIDRGRILRIRNFNKLDSFINLKRPKPDSLMRMVYIDVSYKFSIRHIVGNDTTRYTGDFHDLFGQPVSRIMLNDKENKVLNLEINKVLQDILPKQSMLRKRISIETLTDDYVAWFLKEVL